CRAREGGATMRGGVAEPTHNLAATLLDGAVGRDLGDRTALREGASTVTYAELRERVRRVAGGLQALGIRPGDRVVVFLPDSIDAAGAVLGAILAGAVGVPVGELARGLELRGILADAGASLVVTDAALRPHVDGAGDRLPELRTIVALGGRDGHDLLGPTAPAIDAEPRAADAIAALLYSGGA